MSTDHAASSTASMVIDRWINAFHDALASMTQHDCEVTSAATEDLATDDPEWQWWSLQLSLLPHPGLWLGASHRTWETLGQAVLSALGVPTGAPDECISLSRELISNAARAVLRQFVRDLGTDLTCSEPEPSSRPEVPASVISIAGTAGKDTLETRLAIHPALLDELAKLSAAANAEIGAMSNTLPDAIAGLFLQVNLVLGKTTLPLQDVLKLNVGSVIKLGRSVADPAVVVVNGRVIASGPVVVTNGNYAVQVRPADSHL